MEADYTNFTFEAWLANMSTEDANRYIRWHDYADNDLITYEYRVRVLNCEYVLDADLYVNNKLTSDNPEKYNQVTSECITPPNEGFVESTFKTEVLKKIQL